MAVRHGYGKIAGTDALVFAYDTGDTINSYRGKPATNIVTTISSRGPGVTADPSDLPTVPKSVASAVYCSSKIDGSTTSWESLFQYNTSFSVPDGQRLTVSAWVYIPEGKINNRFNFNCSVNGANTGLTVGSHDVPTGKWVKIHGHYLNSTGATVSVTSTRLETYTAAEWTGTSISCWAINFMVEQSADIPSGYTGSPATALGATRSATQGLLDLTGTNDITVANVSFDSNAQMVFDGTDDVIGYINVGISDYSEPFTMECVFMVDPAATWDNGYRSNIFGIAGSYAGMYGLNKHGGDSVGLYVRDASGGSGCDVGGLSKGVYYHLVGTWDGTDDIRIYLNGSLSNTTTSAKSGAPDSTAIWVGGTRAYSGAGGQVYHGEIPVAKYYNRVLTAGEARNNYRHYKTRFNI